MEIGAQVVHLTADPALTELLTWAGIEVVPAPPDIDVHLVRNGVRRSAAEINRDQPPAPWQLARLFDQRTGTVADAVGGLSEPARAAALAWWEQVDPAAHRTNLPPRMWRSYCTPAAMAR